MAFARRQGGADEICGLYYSTSTSRWQTQRHYLPQVKVASHTTINAICYITALHQTFCNSSEDTISQARYTFPLYDGVAVSGYTINFGDTKLKGVVKQNEAAKKTYQNAVDKGETAGLLEALPAGVFGVTLGNIPPRTDVHVHITYCGELKHDASVDGLRYTLPTSIAPRYGDYPGELLPSTATNEGGISITVDVDMGKSVIRKIQSPSHLVAVSMGAFAAHEGAPFEPSEASASLALGSAELAGDFILQLAIDNLSAPQAVIEQHPILSSRAVMATLVPRFELDTSHPEIVFIADQSGSMQGSKNTSLVSALNIFIKSLPVGVRFNMCAFGIDYKFLWPKSKAYNQANMEEAIRFVNTFNADYGGTELLKPVKAAFEQALGDLPLEMMLLTDGEIWGEDQLFENINKQLQGSKSGARVFALGIGDDVSHTLVEGVARAGNGFAQFVRHDEDIDRKVIRMLKGALYPHTTDYQVEVAYTDDLGNVDNVDKDDDFEIVERVNYCLNIDGDLEDAAKPLSSKNEATEERSYIGDTLCKTISFFNAKADLDKPIKTETEQPYTHLPAIDPPGTLQAPSNLPSFFPFNRTTFYLLLGPESPSKHAKSITIKAKSPQGPLELTIDITPKDTTGTTIHQLAAKKAIQDLEEGRGWLHSAKTTQGAPVKDVYKSRFDELVEREAVRLGERFQVAGKWTSFVAVQDSLEESPYDAGEDSTGPPPVRPVAETAMAMAMPTGSVRYLMGRAPVNRCVMSSSVDASQEINDRMEEAEDDNEMGFALFDDGDAPAPLNQYDKKTSTAKERGLHSLIALQSFSGAWHWSQELFFQTGMDGPERKPDFDPAFGTEDVMATALAVTYMETKLAAESEVWEMVVAKAKQWMGTQVDPSIVDGLIEEATVLVSEGACASS